MEYLISASKTAAKLFLQLEMDEEYKLFVVFDDVIEENKMERKYLTIKERSLFIHLFKNRNRCVSTEELVPQLYGNYNTTTTEDVTTETEQLTSSTNLAIIGEQKLYKRVVAAVKDLEDKLCRFVKVESKDKQQRLFFSSGKNRSYQFVASVKELAFIKESDNLSFNPSKTIELYKRGTFCLAERSPKMLWRSLYYFREALEQGGTQHSSLTIQIYLKIIDAYILLGFHNEIPRQELLEKLSKYTKFVENNEKKLENADKAEFYASVANIKMLFHWQWEESKILFNKAIEFDRRNSKAHHWYANCLIYFGLFDEAYQEINLAFHAVEHRGPIHSINNIINNRAYIRFLSGHYEEAIKDCENIIKIHPNCAIAYATIGCAYIAKYYLGSKLPNQTDKDLEEAINYFQKSVELSGRMSICLANLGHALALKKDTEKANKILRDLEEMQSQEDMNMKIDQYNQAWSLALVYAGLKDTDKAIDCLEKAYEGKLAKLSEIAVHPFLFCLRPEPRFQNLLKNLGIENAAEKQAELLYRGGIDAWHYRSKGIDQVDWGIEHNTNIIKKYPWFSDAYAQIANHHLFSAATCNVPSPEAIQIAKEYVEKAIQIKETSDAYSVFGSLQMCNYDWEAAKTAFQKALGLNRKCKMAHKEYACFLICIGKVDDAIAEIKEAEELWGETSPVVGAACAWIYYMSKKYELAEQQAKKVIKMDGQYVLAHNILGRAQSWLGKTEDAIRNLEEAVALSKRFPGHLADLGYVYAKLQYTEKAYCILKELDELEFSESKVYISAYSRALVWSGLGDKTKTLRYLEKAYEHRIHRLVFLGVEPAFGELRNELPFKELLQKLGFPKYISD